MKNTRKSSVRELEDEINMNMNGTVCAPRHVKVLCRRIIQENSWKINRIKKNLPIDTLPSTKYCSELR